MPDISYITSCYNSEEFLDGLFHNLLQQHNENFEHIVVDSASTDDSVRMITAWQAKDSRIKLIRQDERTPYGVSWLEGWQAAQGLVVTNTNTDDRSYQWRGDQVMTQFKARRITRDIQPFAFYYGGYETRIDGTVIAKGLPPQYSVDDMSQFFRCGIHIHWDYSLHSRVDWDRMFKAANEYKSAFDYWLVLYFMYLGAEGVPIPSCFSIYNQRADSLEQGDKRRSNFEALRAIQTFYPEGKSSQDLENLTKFDSPEYYAEYKKFLATFGEQAHNTAMKKVITFSLWGEDAKYCTGALRNAELAPEIYPGWTCRFYLSGQKPEYNSDTPIGVMSNTVRYLMQMDHVEIVTADEPPNWRGMFWRFRPASEDDVDVFISRDCDSRLSLREAQAVEEWLASPQLVHSMGDHPYHFNPSQALMGGMFGMKRYACPEMRKIIDLFLSQYPDAWQCDQSFLKDHIWPIVQHKVMAHSDMHAGCNPFPSDRHDKDFVGAVIGPNDERLHPEHHKVL